jgi:hypothetical protein
VWWFTTDSWAIRTSTNFAFMRFAVGEPSHFARAAWFGVDKVSGTIVAACVSVTDNKTMGLQAERSSVWQKAIKVGYHQQSKEISHG